MDQGWQILSPLCASRQSFPTATVTGVGAVSYSKAGELIELATMAAGRHFGVTIAACARGTSARIFSRAMLRED